MRKGVAHIKAHGVQKACAGINKRKGAFVDRELYLVVCGRAATCLAHGADERQIGLGPLNLTDEDGTYFVRDRIALAKRNPAGSWA